MKFKINDAVAVLDDDLSGTITSIQGSEITVATSTGFDLVFDSNELVKIKENLMGVHSLFSNTSLDSVLTDKESKKRQNPSKISSKDRNQPTMEVDLHINQLVKNARENTRTGKGIYWLWVLEHAKFLYLLFLVIT